jgi:RimJ/RimL family protein N-acetyltransferase
MNIRLCPTLPADLPILFDHQVDEEASRVAAVKPRSREDFHTHWLAVLQRTDTTTRTIRLDEVVVGTITCFPSEGHHEIGYWIGREFWGRGIVTRAIQQLLEVVSIRPLVAKVATANVASIRALQRNGFTTVEVRDSPATERYLACEEAVLRLE